MAEHLGVSVNAVQGIGDRQLITFTYHKEPKQQRARRYRLKVKPDDVPCRTIDYGGISITWTVGEWRRLQEVKSGTFCADNIMEG